MICAVTPDLHVTVEKLAPIDTDYLDVINYLPKDEPRFVVFNWTYEVEDGAKRHKVVMALWCV